VGFAKKGGVGQMVEIPDPFFRHGLVIVKQGGGEADQGTRKIKKTEGVETRFFAFFDQFGEVHMGCQILLPGIEQGIRGGGVSGNRHQGA